MKQLFVLFAFVAASAANASTVKVATVDASYNPPASSYPSDVSVAGSKFEVNSNLTRARLVVSYQAEYTCGGDDPCYSPNDSEVQLPALSFDAARSQIVYKNDDGKLTACATVTIGQGIFGRRVKVKDTGLCTVSSSTEEVTTDDGWEVSRRKVLNVFLNVQE